MEGNLPMRCLPREMMTAASDLQSAEPTTTAVRRSRGLASRAFDPVPIAPLVQFRIALGLILLWEAYRYLAEGWPRLLFLDAELLFHYAGFEWVRLLPEQLHLAVVPALAALAACLMCGLFYRVAASLLFVGWAYLFLLDQSLYLNHLYLVILIIGLSILLPANRAFSLDVLMRPSLRSATTPRWTLSLLRAQVGLVYFFGGVAKLNPDWLSGIPMQQMLLERAGLIGQPAGEPWIALLFAYGGLLLDLFIVPLLCWKRTRIAGLLLVAGFHLTNHMLFHIGIFPWFMMAATLILWPPYPLSVLSLARIYGSLVGIGILLTLMTGGQIPAWIWGVAVVTTAVLIFPPEELRRIDAAFRTEPDERPAAEMSPMARSAVLAFLCLYLGWQFLMPLRHFVYDFQDGRYGDDASWTEQGHKWAWHMKLRVKRPGAALFFVLDGDRRIVEMIDPFDEAGPLTFRQARTMTTRPDLILQFAHYLRDKYQQQLGEPVAVTASIQVALNGRSPQYLIDPEANLAAIEPRLWPPAEWILPLDAPRPELRRVDVAELLRQEREFLEEEALE